MTAPNEPQSATGMEVAVIGMAARFPGAPDIDAFWENLSQGVESVTFFSHRELIDAGLDPAVVSNPHYIKGRGMLEDVDYFDAAFFHYTPTEAEVMDPQIRLFHECAWHALEDAGYDPISYRGLIGVYAGFTPSLWWKVRNTLRRQTPGEEDYNAEFLNHHSFATLICYRLHLRGPGVTVQTACSTSLVAIHLAGRGVLTGEADMALAGGVSLGLPPNSGYLYQEGMINSPDGHCRAFAAGAAGTVPGDGVGVVVLKRLGRAIREGDHIYAVVKGSGINNDGSRRVGYTAPGVAGQAELIHLVQRVAEVEPESIAYIEAHGTGTPLGDPIEVEGLSRAFHTEKRGFCRIGSLKSSVGHLDNAAGVAGFIKAVLAVKNRLLPPSLHAAQPNPEIDWQATPFVVNNELREWPQDHYPRRAGVSSFGIGGTNAHLILEEYREGGHPSREGIDGAGGDQVIVWSAGSETALDRLTANLAHHLRENPGIDLADLAYTLQKGRCPLPFRRMLVSGSTADAANRLSCPDSGGVHTFRVKAEAPPLVFMFPGQGAQYANMGRELYEQEPVFHRQMDRCFEILETLTTDDLKEVWLTHPAPSGHPSQEGINRTEAAQPLLFAIEYALAQLLMAWGLRPYAMIGHSIGEYTAACLAGVFSLEDALHLVVWRGRLMQSLPAGAMLSVPLSEQEIRPFLDDRLALAAENGPCLCVVSGPTGAVDDLTSRLKQEGHECRRLHTSHAFHSAMMEPILDPFFQEAAAVELHPPGLPYISNVSGNWITVEQAKDPGYWRDQLRQTVRFSSGLGQLFEKTPAVFVEVGPGHGLAAMVRRHPQRRPGHRVVNLIRHPDEEASDRRFLRQGLGQLWLYGAVPDWSAVHGQEKRRRLQLPLYPFDRHHYPLNGTGVRVAPLLEGRRPGTLKKADPVDWFYLPQWLRSLPSPLSGEEEPPRYRWLILLDDCGLGKTIAEELQKNGQEVMTVERGTAFADPGEGAFAVNPGQEGDYEALIRTLADSHRLPQRILHLWALAASATQESPTAWLERGFFCLIYLVRALGRQGFSHEIEITAVANGLQEVAEEGNTIPGKMTLFAALRVIPQEYPGLRCRSIDVVWPPPDTEEKDRLTRQLLGELTGPLSEPTVALRGGRRWVETFVPVQLKERSAPLRWLRQKGVYLITGGLGGIGLVLAEYLAQTVQARLILTGRTDPPPGKMQKIERLEEMGAEVLTFRADAADEAGMRQAVQTAGTRFGPINGVIHGAGITGGAAVVPIEETTPARCEPHFRAKVDGLLVLEKIFRQENLDFCLLMSSLSSILGGVGFAAYAAANLFMDGFARRQRRGPGRPTWISVNWDGWRLAEGQTAELSMEPHQGLEALARILAWRGSEQVVLSTGDLSLRLQQWIRLQPQKEEPSSLYVRPDLSTPYVPPRNWLEKIITGIFQKYFGLDRVGIHDNFFELGATSLDMIQLARKIKTAVGQEVSIVTLFRHATIDALVAHLDRPQLDGTAAENMSTDRGEQIRKGRARRQDAFNVRRGGG